MKNRLKKILLILAALYIVVFFALYFFQEKLIFLPSTLQQNYTYSFPSEFEELFITSEDGARLNSLHFKAENSKGVILYFHGNAGDLSRWGQVVQQFVALDYDVLIMDYRTYGKSTGKLNEKNLYADAQLFYNYLLKSYQEERIIVYGRSLGTTFATFVASKNNPKRLYLEAPFYNLGEVAQSRFPIYPASWFLKYTFPTYAYLKEVNSPTVIFHGIEDAVINFSNSEKLSKIETKGNVTFISVADGTHHNLNESTEFKKVISETLQ